ncbi:MAG: hypothetical protein OQK98_06610 [Gammaproteobacteria bacterium]|nr:hypothetical protein [Gammaproteobacteria bacterium]
MLNDPYTPVDCAIYDIYEIAIMQNKKLKLKWLADGGQTFNEDIKPIKLLIKNKAEYLILDSEIISEIRLDKIIRAEII